MVEGQIHGGTFWEVGGLFTREEGGVFFEDFEVFLGLNLERFGGFEGDCACETYSFALRLCYVDDSGTVGATVSDYVDFVDEGDG